MEELENKKNGYVYVLEVKDITLPVCKIGMTTRSPYKRCDEINNSSTGDFIWSVVHYISVDNCQKLESLIHRKLTPLRQKGREFFNVSADDANVALLSIFDSQTEIKKINNDEISPQNKESKSRNKRSKNKQISTRVGTEYSELLHHFASLLNVKGRPFGQLNKPIFGMSDGNEGVQWNLAVSTDSGAIHLGVNLEGMKYRDWPISKFIQSELNNPKIGEIADTLNSPGNIFVRFSRDAWQVTSRPSIVEKFLGGKEFTLSEMNTEQWKNTLEEALGCLNKEKNYCSRAKQTVTLESMPKNGVRVRIMDVSPHLTVWSPLDITGDIQENLEYKIAELKPIYDWIKDSVEP